jgi:hypothetical protein
MKGTVATIMSEEMTPEMRPKVRMVFHWLLLKDGLRLRTYFNAAEEKLSSFFWVILGFGGKRCDTIWYKAAFKGGVYETRKTVWVFRGAEVRRVATLEGGPDTA